VEDGDARGMNIPKSRMDATAATDRSTHTNLSRHRFVDLFRNFQVEQCEDVAANNPDLVMAAPVLALLHEHGWDLGVVLTTKDTSITLTAAIYMLHHVMLRPAASCRVTPSFILLHSHYAASCCVMLLKGDTLRNAL